MNPRTLIVSLLVASFAPSAGARNAEPSDRPPPPTPRAAEAPAGPVEPLADRKLPWDVGVVYRYAWLEGADKVGETSFRVSETREGEQPAYEIRTTRSYDRAPSSTRSVSTTWMRKDGHPVRFEETLDLSAGKGLRARQEIQIAIEDGTARAKYVHNGKEELAATHELALPPGTFLAAGQAVEHWALFTSRIPAGTKEITLGVYYPDFKEILKVTFRGSGSETVRIDGKPFETEVYRFATPEGRLEGSIWLDPARRMVQIEFPSRSTERKALRVVLAP